MALLKKDSKMISEEEDRGYRLMIMQGLFIGIVEGLGPFFRCLPILKRSQNQSFNISEAVTGIT